MKRLIIPVTETSYYNVNINVPDDYESDKNIDINHLIDLAISKHDYVIDHVNININIKDKKEIQ